MRGREGGEGEVRRGREGGEAGGREVEGGESLPAGCLATCEEEV